MAKKNPDEEVVEALPEEVEDEQDASSGSTILEAYFQGAYVETMRDCCVAGVASHVNVVLVGPPGCGKTEVANYIAYVISDGKFFFLDCDEGTPPEVIKGMHDPELMLGSPPKFVLVVKGTPMDLDYLTVVYDELYRLNSVSRSAAMHSMARKDVPRDESPVAIGTTNFLATEEKYAALLDRSGLYYHVQPHITDTKAFVSNHLRGLHTGLKVPGHIPTRQEVLEVRKAVPGNNADRCVGELIDFIANEAASTSDGKYKFDPSLRRLAQWSRLVYRTSVLYTGTADFSTVPNEAASVMQWAYPTTSYDMWLEWQAITSVAADPVQSAIDAMMKEAFGKFVAIREASTSDKPKLARELGVALQDAEVSMEELFGDEDSRDPRVNSAMEQVVAGFGRALQGEDPMAVLSD